MEIPPASASDSTAWAEQFLATLHAEEDQIRRFLAAQQERLDQAGSILQRRIHALEEELQAKRCELEQLQLHTDELRAKLAEAKNRSLDDGGNDRSEADEENRRRYELALDDIRRLRNKNAELQDQVAKARMTAANLARQAQQPSALDWEAEKRRIMMALEADDENDEAQGREHLKIREVMRSTEEAIAAKDAEIADLKRINEELRNTAANKHDAHESSIANDALICEERNRLRELQDEWREKLRQAEVELSMERAKIARQRAELDEKLRAVGASVPPAPATPANLADASPTRGRWLAHLGLSQADLETRR